MKFPFFKFILKYKICILIESKYLETILWGEEILSNKIFYELNSKYCMKSKICPLEQILVEG